MPQPMSQKRKLTRPEYKRKAQEILRLLSAEVGGWQGEDATPAARAERLRRCQDDSFEFGRTYLPHYFSSPPAAFHRQMVELLRPRGRAVVPVVADAPRGFAKSTTVSFCYVLQQACFKKRHFVILGSDTSDLASDLTAYLHLEMIHNERLMADFGEGAPLADPNAAIDDFTCMGNSVRILARGRGQRVRGLKHGAHRPDLVILDDLENDKNVKNPRLVKELLKWIKEAVYPAIDPGGSLFWVGTILSKKSALAIALAGSEEPFGAWTRCTDFAKALITDKQGNLQSLWPERFSVSDLLEQKRLMGSLAFNKEKQNDPRDEDGAFLEEWINGHAFDLRVAAAGVHPVVGFLDPSMSTNQSADPRAIVAVMKHPAEGLLIVDCYLRREPLPNVLRHVWAMNEIWRFVAFGVEATLFQKLLLPEFDRLGRELGYLPVRGVEQSMNKEARIVSLSPLVERGLLRFPRPEQRTADMRELVEQFVYFPGTHDDGPDATEGAVRMINTGAPNVW